MVLVDRRGLTRQALPTVAASRAATKKQKRHRVIIESVGQEQKKLKTTISFQARPPNGYTFIPAGNPELTNALKEASREANQQIYAVSASPHAQVHDLSKEVHRIGFHFATVIVARVCASYGITLTSKGTVAEDNADTFRQMRQKGGWNNGSSDDKKKDQMTINTEARGAIKDLFPKIPDNDLFTIIKGAFQKGQKKVGTANELPLVRRAQLSVVAHVRHVYTKYDKLLRTVGYREARAQVEGPTLKKLVEWRGDDDSTISGKHALEDVMREVIVLTDDEDSDDDTDDVVEVVSTRTDGRPLPSHLSIADARPLSPRQYDYQSGDDTVPGYRVIAEAPRRRRLLDSQTQASAQYRQSRYAAWDRAREEYRANPSAVPMPLVPLAQHDPKFYYQEPGFNFNDPPIRVQQDLNDLRRPEQYPSYGSRQVVHDQGSIKADLVCGGDGHLYERIYAATQQGVVPQRRHDRSQAYVSSQPSSPRYAPYHEGHDAGVQALNSRILPSIEDSQPVPLEDSRFRAHQPEYRVDQTNGRMENTHVIARPRNVQVIDLTEGADAQIAKRRRVEEPSGTRRVADRFGDMAIQEVPGRLARPLQQPEREIIDLSSPRYVRDPLPRSPRLVLDRRLLEWDVDRGQGIRSDGRAFHPLVEVPHNAPPLRHAFRPDAVFDQDKNVGLPSTSRFRERNLDYADRQYVQQPSAAHRPEDITIGSEYLVAGHATNGRNVLVPSTRMPVYDGGNVSYSREYLPVIRNEVLMPDARAHLHQQPLYVDTAQGPQYDRYERMPPPTYVRN